MRVTWRAVWLGLVALVLMTAMVVLGLWQLGVYDDRQHADSRSQLQRPPVPIGEVIGPDDAFPSDGVARPVTVTGHYLPSEQFEVVGSPTLGTDRAVVTPLLVDGAGSAVLVVRGTGSASAAPPTGTVRLTAVLEPSDATGSAVDSNRRTDGLRVAALVQSVKQDLYAGYAVLRSSQPADTLTPVEPPLPDASRWAGIRNLLYAFQWWVFAGFVAFMWWRIVQDEDAGADEPARDPAAPAPSGDTGAESPRSVG